MRRSDLEELISRADINGDGLIRYLGKAGVYIVHFNHFSRVPLCGG